MDLWKFRDLILERLDVAETNEEYNQWLNALKSVEEHIEFFERLEDEENNDNGR